MGEGAEARQAARKESGAWDLTKTTDLTAGMEYGGTANERDLNSVYSNNFYNYLSGATDNDLSTGLATDNALSIGLAKEARKQADAAFSPFGTAMGEYAKTQSEQQRRAMEQRLATGGMLGTGSGAATAAIAQAIASPYAQANAQMQQQYGQLYNNSYGNLLGQLSGMSQQQIVAPQFQTQDTLLGTGVNLGAGLLGDLGGALIGLIK